MNMLHRKWPFGQQPDGQRPTGQWPDGQRHAGSVPRDYGESPYVVDISKAAQRNVNFRTTLWTGKHLQATVMSIPVGGDVGLEIHPYVDQFIVVADGAALAMMGSEKNALHFRKPAFEDYAIFIPAGVWHNIINTGNKMLKLYTVYAPPEHAAGTVHRTQDEADAEEM